MTLQFIKIGSSCIFDDDYNIRYGVLKRMASEIVEQKTNQGIDTVIVSSGAIPYGKVLEGDYRKNSEIPTAQLRGYATTGQTKLMGLYDDLFPYKVGQILWTDKDLKDKKSVKDVIDNNISREVLNIINWNDATDSREARRNNDIPAARGAVYCDADYLIIRGPYDGFCNPDGSLVEHLSKVTKEHYSYCNGTSNTGCGGFEAKLDAGKIMLKNNKKMIIGNIFYSLDDILKGNAPRTLFSR
jgi:glutamate 5-kinase